MFKPTLMALMVAGLLAQVAPAQTTHDHGATTAASAGPTEPGQGAFAAIAEIVALLRADPETDWGSVDIASLRQHLVDMDQLVTSAEVTQDDRPGGAVFRAKLSGPGGAAVGRMVTAHAPVLAAETGWSSSARPEGDELVWTVTSPDAAEAIRALGFFGLMAIGDHHRAHHLALATGRKAH